MPHCVVRDSVGGGPVSEVPGVAQVVSLPRGGREVDPPPDQAVPGAGHAERADATHHPQVGRVRHGPAMAVVG